MKILFTRGKNVELKPEIRVEELHSLYRSPNIVRMIKSRKLRWADNVARTEEGGSDFKI